MNRVSGFARQRKYEETVAALAELSKSSIDVIRPLMQSLRDDGVLVPCRVAGLNWDTVAQCSTAASPRARWARTSWREQESNTPS